MKKRRVVAFIPLRGESKSIPLKNIKLIAGKPLLFWTVNAALLCKNIDDVYISTDSQIIKDTVLMLFGSRVSVIGRSQESASDEASSEVALLEFCENYFFDDVFFIQATSPLLTAQDLAGAWSLYTDKKSDSVLSIVRQKRFIWKQTQNGSHPVNYVVSKRPRRQDWDGFLVENGAFYLSSRKAILKSKQRISGKINLYEMHSSTYYEIDELDDWIAVQSLLEKISNKKGNALPAQKAA